MAGSTLIGKRIGRYIPVILLYSFILGSKGIDQNPPPQVKPTSYKLKKGEKLEVVYSSLSGSIQSLTLYHGRRRKVDLGHLIHDTSYLKIKSDVDFDGLGLLVAQLQPSAIYKTEDGMQKWLQEEGNNTLAIDTLPSKQGRILLNRHYNLKTLVCTEETGKDGLNQKVIGKGLEILLIDNPYDGLRRFTFKCKVLYNGMPLPNVILKATFTSKDDRNAVIETHQTTNNEGIATFEGKGPGTWTLSARKTFKNENSGVGEYDCFYGSFNFGEE